MLALSSKSKELSAHFTRNDEEKGENLESLQIEAIVFFAFTALNSD